MQKITKTYRWLKNNIDLTKGKIFVNIILLKVFLKQKTNYQDMVGQ